MIMLCAHCLADIPAAPSGTPIFSVRTRFVYKQYQCFAVQQRPKCRAQAAQILHWCRVDVAQISRSAS
jgi:hypothetical protein